MSTTYTPDGSTYHPAVQLPSDGDPAVAASVNAAGFQYLADNTAWLHLRGGAKPDLQSFTSVGGGYTWTKPANATWVELVVISGGGAGGNGDGSNGGGGGGSSGQIWRSCLPASAVPGTLSVTVGSGGSTSQVTGAAGWKIQALPGSNGANASSTQTGGGLSQPTGAGGTGGAGGGAGGAGGGMTNTWSSSGGGGGGEPSTGDGGDGGAGMHTTSGGAGGDGTAGDPGEGGQGYGAGGGGGGGTGGGGGGGGGGSGWGIGSVAANGSGNDGGAGAQGAVFIVTWCALA